MTWSVVESVPVHEDIKTRSGNYQQYINNYKESLKNLAEAGIKTVCYNFMPVLDWTRTDLDFEIEDGSKALRFDNTAFLAFELYILKRQGALKSYCKEKQVAAYAYYQAMNADDIAKLTSNIIAGLPGAEEGYSLEEFQAQLNKYKDIDKKCLTTKFGVFFKRVNANM